MANNENKEPELAEALSILESMTLVGLDEFVLGDIRRLLDEVVQKYPDSVQVEQISDEADFCIEQIKKYKLPKNRKEHADELKYVISSKMPNAISMRKVFHSKDD